MLIQKTWAKAQIIKSICSRSYTNCLFAEFCRAFCCFSLDAAEDRLFDLNILTGHLQTSVCQSTWLTVKYLQTWATVQVTFSKYCSSFIHFQHFQFMVTGRGSSLSQHALGKMQIALRTSHSHLHTHKKNILIKFPIHFTWVSLDCAWT